MRNGVVSMVLLLASCTMAGVPEPRSDSDVDREQNEVVELDPPRDTDPGPPRPESCPATAPYIASIETRVVDERGAGLANAKVQWCVTTLEERLLCVAPATSDADGNAVVSVSENARCMTSAVVRVLMPNAPRPTVYCPLALPLDDASIRVLDPYILAAADEPLSLPPRGNEEAERVVDLGSGAQISLAPSSLGVDEYERLAGLRIDAANASKCIKDGAPGAAQFLALAPDADVVEEATLTVTTSLTGHVEVWVLAGLRCVLDGGDVLKEGDWEKIGSATIADGRITTSLPCLGWLGFVQ